MWSMTGSRHRVQIYSSFLTASVVGLWRFGRPAILPSENPVLLPWTTVDGWLPSHAFPWTLTQANQSWRWSCDEDIPCSLRFKRVIRWTNWESCRVKRGQHLIGKMLSFSFSGINSFRFFQNQERLSLLLPWCDTFLQSYSTASIATGSGS